MPQRPLSKNKSQDIEDREDLDYARIIDVHRWSNFKEVNEFVDRIYEVLVKPDTEHDATKWKKHLKIVLLDLYVAWIDDRKLNIAVHMANDDYTNGSVFTGVKSRYNELFISKTITKVIRRLDTLGYICRKAGYPSDQWKGKLTKIWARDSLIQQFESAMFSYFDMGYSEERLTVIIRDKDKKDKEYKPSPCITDMEKVLKSYNALLNKTFIDVPALDKPYFEVQEKRTKKIRKVPISHHMKFTYRVFNEGSLKYGGRFYGGWWQRISQDNREKIYLNDKPTVEIDYKSLHPVLAYAKVGIDYNEEIEEDPYAVQIDWIKDEKMRRGAVKLLFLLALNAKKEKTLFNAFRQDFEYSKYPLRIQFTDDKLKEMLEAIKQKHPKIAHLIATGAGLELMNIDSKMAEFVIKDFISTDSPILCIHDSFIVEFGEDKRLERVMAEAFRAVADASSSVSIDNPLTTKRLDAVTEYKYSTGFDRDYYLDNLKDFKPVVRSKGYKERLARHKKHFTRK